ncbi:MAG: MarR family transcriptional regulator [Anaerolineales bacterium]|jgi:DNA-binding MarR family transcriptional regulator
MSSSNELDQALRDWVAVFMRRSMHEFMDSMKDTGLSMAQLTTLIRLHYHGPCPISGIGDDLGVTTAAASQMVDRLVHLGLLERTEAPDDRRVRNVNLTDAAVELVRRGVEARVGWMRDLSTELTPKQQASVVESIRHLTQAALALEHQQPVNA